MRRFSEGHRKDILDQASNGADSFQKDDDMRGRGSMIREAQTTQEVNRAKEAIFNKYGTATGTAMSSRDFTFIEPMEEERTSMSFVFDIVDPSGRKLSLAPGDNTEWRVYLYRINITSGRQYHGTTNYWDDITRVNWNAQVGCPPEPLEERYPNAGGVSIKSESQYQTGNTPVGLGDRVTYASPHLPIPCAIPPPGVTRPDKISGWRFIRGGREDQVMGGGLGNFGPGRYLLNQDPDMMNRRGFLNIFWESQPPSAYSVYMTGQNTSLGPVIFGDQGCGSYEGYSTPYLFYNTFTDTHSAAGSQGNTHTTSMPCAGCAGDFWDPCLLETAHGLNARFGDPYFKLPCLQGSTRVKLQSTNDIIPRFFREIFKQLGYRQWLWASARRWPHWDRLNPYHFRTDYLAIDSVNDVKVANIPLTHTVPSLDVWGPYLDVWTKNPPTRSS